MTHIDIVEAIESEIVENLSESEIRKRNFMRTYVDWAHASHQLMRMSIIMERWEKYVVARDAYLDFRFN